MGLCALQQGWVSEWQRDGSTCAGLLLLHVHNQWGMADAVVIASLANGADGVWASIAEEGAAQGHACSCVTIANLARLGNADVVTRFKTHQIAHAARQVTRFTINDDVHQRQVVYGPRAIEAVFGFAGIAGGKGKPMFDVNGDGKIDELDCFSLAKFLGIPEQPIRISTLASEEVGRVFACFRWRGRPLPPPHTHTPQMQS